MNKKNSLDCARFIVLHCEKESLFDVDPPYYSKGIVLKRVGDDDDDIYFCLLVDDDADKKFDEGDVVVASLKPGRDYPMRDYHYDDFYVESIRLSNKLSWMKLK